MKFPKARHTNKKTAPSTGMMPLDDELLEFVAGGLDATLPGCKNHQWVFTGSSTDAFTNVTLKYYKCSKCNAEKTERA